MKISKKWNKAHVECWFNSPDPGEEFLVLAHIYGGSSSVFFSKYNPNEQEFERKFIKKGDKIKDLLIKHYTQKYDEFLIMNKNLDVKIEKYFRDPLIPNLFYLYRAPLEVVLWDRIFDTFILTTKEE